MKRNILLFGCIISCFIISLSTTTSAISSYNFYNTNDTNASPGMFALRFYFGEAHGYYINENGSGFGSYNCLEIRIWKYWDMNDNDSGIKFLHNKENASWFYGYGWNFYGIIGEGFVFGFFSVYGEIPQPDR